MNLKKTVVICLSILLAGALLTTLIFYTQPTAQRTGATKTTAILVEVAEAEKGTFEPLIRSIGTVVPSQDVVLSPRVEGEIVERAGQFTPGSFVRKGDTLLRIDPEEYQYTLDQRIAELDQAEANLEIEKGLQDAARKEIVIYGSNRVYGDTLTPDQQSLFLRQPQLNSVQASLKIAESAVDLARLNLKRTVIVAPFDAHVLTRNVNVGSQLAPGNNLGRIVGLDSYWVETTVPQSKIRWLTLPDTESGRGSEVSIRNRSAWPEGETRTGYLLRVVGSLENQTRLARVLVEIPDPLGYRNPSNSPPLIIGSVVEVKITGKPLQNVARISREYVRTNDTVWIMEENELRIKDIKILMEDEEYAYISEGVSGGDKIVTTNLSTVRDGVPLRTQGDDDNTQTEQQISERQNSGF